MEIVNEEPPSDGKPVSISKMSIDVYPSVVVCLV